MGNMIGLALSSPPDDPLPTLDQARQSLCPSKELMLVRDWLARNHPDVDDALETYIFDYVREFEQ